MGIPLRLCAVIAVVVFVWQAPPTAQAPAEPPRGSHWVASWATASLARPSPRFSNQTLRQIVYPTLGGSRVRVVLSNVFGTAPLRIGQVAVGLAGEQGVLRSGSVQPVAFAGATSADIPAGATLTSDSVDLRVGSLQGLIIDVYLPGGPTGADSPVTVHPNALQTNFVSAAGNHAGAANFPVASSVTSWFFLARMDVFAPPDAATVVALGDSITDGAGSTIDANSRWPDHLARALADRGVRMGVVNLGISGNRVLADGAGASTLNRFERDVLSQPGATHLVLVQGINDIGRDATAASLGDAYRQLAGRARSSALTPIGGTLSPMEGASFEGYYTDAHEQERQRVNGWIRTGGEYHAVFDIDAAVRDPSRPTRLLPELAAPDWIHPNDRGYRAIAAAFDLTWLRR